MSLSLNVTDEPTMCLPNLISDSEILSFKFLTQLNPKCCIVNIKLHKFTVNPHSANYGLPQHSYCFGCITTYIASNLVACSSRNIEILSGTTSNQNGFIIWIP